MESSRALGERAARRGLPAREGSPRAASRVRRADSMAAAARIEERLKRRTARVGVIGLGYVGLPLAVEFAKAGVHVTGFEIDERRVERLNRGSSYIQDVPTPVLRDLVRKGMLRATTDF